MKRACILMLLCGGWLCTVRPEAAEPTTVSAAMGIMIGEVTDRSALAQVRLNSSSGVVEGDVPGAAGLVEFQWREMAGAWQPAQRVAASDEHDFIARAVLEPLRAGAQYEVRTRIGRDSDSLTAGPTARFRTLYGADLTASTRFVVVTGMNYAKFHGDARLDRRQHLLEDNTRLPPPDAGADKHLGYPALETIRKMQPAFFVGTGDNVYYDSPDRPRAQTIPALRQKWHEQFVQPRYVQLFAEVPTYWEIDDHDYRVDDCDNTGDYLPSPDTGRRMMLEQLPLARRDDETARTYRTHRVTRDLQIWLTENRMYRSPNAMPDGPQKSIWGAAQREWLQRTLAESDATYKILISPTPLIGPDDRRKRDNHTNVGGFQHERDAFFAWLRQAGIKNFYVVCGDRHWQYHSIHPAGVEEFSSGALVDENSRLGRKPGDPQSTDPEAVIQQPYYQTPASGGFLLVEVQPANGDSAAELSLQFYDEHGELLYAARKVPQ